MRLSLLIVLLLTVVHGRAQYTCDSLVAAAGRLDVAVVKACLQAGVEPECKGTQQRNPLNAVLNEVRCKYRDNTRAFQIMDELIAAGANLDNPKLTPSGTALEYALSGFSDLCLFHYLEKKGATVDSRVYHRLITYAQHDHILYMLRKGVPLPKEGWLADYILISNTSSAGSDASVMPLLRDTLLSLKRDLQGYNADGLQPLHAAIKIGDTIFLRYLLDAGVDINTPEDMNGWTPLHFAAYYHEANRSYHPGKLKALQWLLERGGEVNTASGWEYQESWTHSFNPKIPEGATPLDVAILCKAPQKAIDLLKAKGARTNVVK